MSSPQEGAGPSLPAHVGVGSDLISRSSVPADLTYPEYREYLRHDFFYSCAYCTMSEAEALGIRMTIDHYEPRRARPDLEHDYYNLMYACDECNIRKGDRCPPAGARVDGFRFFRPDQDVRRQHFERTDLRLEPKTNVGMFSINALDLNRQSLRKLRDIRMRFSQCAAQVEEGITGLRRIPIDQLPREMKGRVAMTIEKAHSFQMKLAEQVDNLLRSQARSPLVDPDPKAEERARQRLGELKQIEALHPGAWRAPRVRR